MQDPGDFRFRDRPEVLCKILEISDSETGLKVEKVGGVVRQGLTVGRHGRAV